MQTTRNNKNNKRLKPEKPKQPAKKNNPVLLAKYLSYVSPMFVLFLTLWIFAAFIYDDVFYMAEQSSFFAFSETLMRHQLDLSYGWLNIAGRFLLLSFKYPWFGALIWAGMLTASVKFLLAVTGKQKALAPLYLALPFAWIAYLVYKELHIYYIDEPSMLFIPPMVAFVLFLSLFLAKLLLRRTTTQPMSNKIRLYALSTVTVLALGSYTYALTAGENTRLTARMQRLMQQQAWNEMIDTALSAKEPSRPIAGYYAIALVQTDQLLDRLFELNYQFPNLRLTTHSGNPDAGINLIQQDVNFYAGLVYTAYHNTMERLVTEGPSIEKVKRLFLCALINDEKMLAEKYLHILEQIPLEGAFIAHYRPMLQNKELIAADPELSRVTALLPVEDKFELDYQAPLFLGYNLVRTNGRSPQALETSLAACLYTKELQALLPRTESYMGKSLPTAVEQAVALYAFKDPQWLQRFNFNPMTTTRINNFLTAAARFKGNYQEGAKALRGSYENFYPYYYYFGNRPDPDAPKTPVQAEEKGGVN